MSSNLFSYQGENKYLTHSELEPLVNAQLEWKLCLSDIRSDNWSRQFEACNIIRRVCKFHLPEIISSGAIQPKGKKNSSTTSLPISNKQVNEEFRDINKNVSIIVINFVLDNQVSRILKVYSSQDFHDHLA